MGMSSYVSPGKPSLNPETQFPPPAGSPKNHSPTSLPRQSASADYATCRHAPRPKGEQRARGCVLWELRSALTISAPVAPRASIKGASCLSTLRTRTTLIRSSAGPPKSTAGRSAPEDTFWGSKKDPAARARRRTFPLSPARAARKGRHEGILRENPTMPCGAIL